MAKSLKDKDLIGEIADIYQDGTLRRGTFDYEDVKEAVSDFNYLNNYDWKYDNNIEVEGKLNNKYGNLCNKYGLNPYEENNSNTLSKAIFGDWENE